MIYNVGRIGAELNFLESLLKKIDLLQERIANPKGLPSALSIFRDMTYTETWEYHIKNQIYNFMFLDSSIIFFNIKDHSYLFFACPYKCMPYKDFVNDLGYDYYDVMDELKEEYENYIQSCKTFEFPVMLRYDYDPASYGQGRHPASHFHLGFNNSTRIGSNKILSPISFIYFILRQCYPEKWSIVLNEYENHTSIPRHYRDLNNIDSSHFQGTDLFEFYLSV